MRRRASAATSSLGCDGFSGGQAHGLDAPVWRSAIRCLGRKRCCGITCNGCAGTARPVGGRHDGLEARLWEEVAMWTPRPLQRERLPAGTSGQP